MENSSSLEIRFATACRSGQHRRPIHVRSVWHDFRRTGQADGTFADEEVIRRSLALLAAVSAMWMPRADGIEAVNNAMASREIRDIGSADLCRTTRSDLATRAAVFATLLGGFALSAGG
jgi:hypothetical protein